MKLTVYKGFDSAFLEELDDEPLVESEISTKKNILAYEKKTRKQLDMALISLEEDESVWSTYEEYTLIKKRVDDAIKEDGLQLIIYRNNLYPDYYPLEFNVDDQLSGEIVRITNGDGLEEVSDACSKYLAVYNYIVDVNGTYYGSFYNFEYENNDHVKVLNFYPGDAKLEDTQETSDYNVFVNDDVDTYLRDLDRIQKEKPKLIGLKITDGEISKKVQQSLFAYCIKNDIRITEYHEKLAKDIEQENELIKIAKSDIKLANFQGFRPIKFYKNPDINKEVIEIAQSQIIREIINQAESAYNDKTGNKFRDIFITASTGAGKSVMFQIPAIYLAKKYKKKITIIIEPVKALMQDQKEKLNKNGFMRVETFNSDLITQVEKEAVLERIKNGEVDLLYLSPETLLSYSIETIIGEMEIGLLIVDEAHIVTTWGVGFRPDYWYLGGYINRLRNQIQYGKKNKQKIYHFPICAFTATAINGGTDDSISDTIISLYMENPIKYIGYVRRDNINFDIVSKSKEKLPMTKYEEAKANDLNERITEWIANNEKTVVYFPYAKLAGDAKRGVRSFAGITTDKRVGIYTGRNIDELSTEAFNAAKRDTFDKFRSGETKVMFATKAFGMGVDVDDIKNVYHYAVTGNLCDYVQEIGRAARKKSMFGKAITDNYYNDFRYMNVLFGMSQIRQYQIKKVLSGIYDTYKSKHESRSFLISPESFTYIFNDKDESSNVNKLKTCLLMIEKDFYDTYTFKVLISRPQSVFTKAFVVIRRECVDKVMNSKYGKCFKFMAEGRYVERQEDGVCISDVGDIYSIDLKTIWEDYHSNISFPQFKYWYFNGSSAAKDKVEIMSSIRDCFSPRQKITIEARGDLLLCDIRDKILEDFEFIANSLYTTYGKSFFSTEEFAKLISSRYGIAKARIIANSLFELVDPDGRCIKHRDNDKTGKTNYQLANGNFKEYMRKPIIKSNIIGNISREKSESYSSYVSISSNDTSSISLKLLSIFDYITYELVGGEEPEIFIRLNDPDKVKNIVLGNTFYSNKYVTKAKQKHERDISILLYFFNNLKTNDERWNYIEDYFLGYDVLRMKRMKTIIHTVPLSKAIDKEHSYPTNQFKKWSDISNSFDDSDRKINGKLAAAGISIPEYLKTTIKKSNLGDNILMSWPSKNVLICSQDTDEKVIDAFTNNGWKAYRFYDVNAEKLKGDLA